MAKQEMLKSRHVVFLGQSPRSVTFPIQNEQNWWRWTLGLAWWVELLEVSVTQTWEFGGFWQEHPIKVYKSKVICFCFLADVVALDRTNDGWLEEVYRYIHLKWGSDSPSVWHLTPSLSNDFYWWRIKSDPRSEIWERHKAPSRNIIHIYIYIWRFVVVFSTDSKNVQPMQGEQFYRYLKLIDEYICRDYLFTYFCADLSVFQTFTIRLSWLRKETKISTKITCWERN